MHIPHTLLPVLFPGRYPARRASESTMIVWGAKSHVVNLGQEAVKHCPTCERARPFNLMLQYTVRHIWYVFRWVTGKQYGVVCDVCQRGDKVDAKLAEAKLTKSPISFGARWGWAFLIGVFAIVLAFDALDVMSRNKSRDAYLAAPLKGDRYVVNAASLMNDPQSKYMYGVMRVRSVNADSIEFDAPSMFYSGVSSATKDIDSGKADSPGYFAPSPVLLSRDEIARILKEHAVHSIVRFPAAHM
jgi:hypothetical protein